MRTPFLAAALGLSLVGCLVGDSGTAGSGADDDDGPGSQGSGSNNPPATARVDVSVDKQVLTTELKTTNPIAVTVAGAGGFSGAVGLTATVVDANNAPIPGWTVDLSAPSVTLAKDGTTGAMATLHIPSLSPTLQATVKITSTSAATLGTPAANVMVTAANQVTFAVKYDATLKDCVFPADGGNAANSVPVSRSSKIRFFNTGTDTIVIHVNGNGTPISHQGNAPNGNVDPATEANTAYEQTPIGTGAASWYCHSTPAGNGKDRGADNPRMVVQ